MATTYDFVSPSFDIGAESNAIRQAAERLAEEYIYEQQRLAQTILSSAYSRGVYEFLRILNSNLDRALEQAPEYSYTPLKKNLKSVINSEGFVRIYGTLENFQVEFDEWALGTRSDWEAGIRYARDMVSGKKRGTKAQRDAYWRNKVYGPFQSSGILDDSNEDEEGTEDIQDAKDTGQGLYENTIRLRMSIWGDTAPYWYLLEYGNSGEGAFPRNGATMFLTNSKRDIKSEMKYQVERVSNELGRDMNDELLRFLNNPHSGTPKNVFLKFDVEGTKYSLYVTETRRLGLAQRIR